MHFQITLRILGSLLMVFSLTMLPPILVSWIYDDGSSSAFWTAALYTFVSGLVLWLLFRSNQDELRTRDGFVVTLFFYVALGMFGSIPLLQSAATDLSRMDAVFESFSGLTTTGATVITGIDSLPPSVLFYRQQLQWLGGMGIIVLAVAILPMLGIGGMQLYRAETPGPVKDSKLTPRIKQTALALWSIYVGLTVTCALAYWAAGMSLFDAICHSFSTVAIGGFSTHDASMGYFNSPAIETVAIVFMLLAGINFALHFFVWRDRSIKHYLQDDETRFYFLVLLTGVVIAIFVLVDNSYYSVPEAIRYGTFQVVSVFTTTGFTTTDFSQWPLLLPFMLMFGAFIGACAGSTGGGLKAMRAMLIYRQGFREIHRLIHPSAIFPIKLNKQPVSNNIIDAIWGFFSIYVIVFLLMTLMLMYAGLDFVTAFSAVGACLNNLGPGLGEVTANYGSLPDLAKGLLCFAMLLGRLEIFPVLVLFSPMFWTK